MMNITTSGTESKYCTCYASVLVNMVSVTLYLRLNNLQGTEFCFLYSIGQEVQGLNPQSDKDLAMLSRN